MALSRSFHTTRGSLAGVHTLPLPTSGGSSQRGSNAKPGEPSGSSAPASARLQAHLSSPDLHDVSKQALATDGGTATGGSGGRTGEDDRVTGSMLARPEGNTGLRIPLEELQREGNAGPAAAGLYSGRDSSRGSVIPMIPKIDLRNAQPDTLGHKRSQSRSGRRLSSMSTSLSSRVDPAMKVSSLPASLLYSLLSTVSHPLPRQRSATLIVPAEVSNWT
jgi:hypothetical protein